MIACRATSSRYIFTAVSGGSIRARGYHRQGTTTRIRSDATALFWKARTRALAKVSVISTSFCRQQRRDAPVIAAARGTVTGIFTLAFIERVDDGGTAPRAPTLVSRFAQN